jgi:hypothetical protein
MSRTLRARRYDTPPALAVLTHRLKRRRRQSVDRERKEIAMELTTVPIEKPADINFTLGQSHFPPGAERDSLARPSAVCCR